MSFTIILTRPALLFNSKAMHTLYPGNTKFVHNLQTYLLSRDYSNLKSEFQNGNHKKIINSIEKQPAVELLLGEHFFLTVADHYL
ncbi:Isoleucine-tRNA ligase cytoplasmic-like [Quillaja saponaria]|uniref:Isoleucine-tRNA ligase cytoplasmic-like n=1 Tax=Quillaja saponaria TaxID=32244 RepID=A0AAD7LAK7_QUISA|nr:Isoleucine-tRNA ligase cytoplasmic-like [Quillaja saponaria]